MEKRILSTKCPKCHTNKMIIASETIEATTDFTFENGICTDTNNEYGNGVRMSFVCKNFFAVAILLSLVEVSPFASSEL